MIYNLHVTHNIKHSILFLLWYMKCLKIYMHIKVYHFNLYFLLCEDLMNEWMNFIYENNTITMIGNCKEPPRGIACKVLKVFFPTGSLCNKFITNDKSDQLKLLSRFSVKIHPVKEIKSPILSEQMLFEFKLESSKMVNWLKTVR